jgi:hypothetical protein
MEFQMEVMNLVTDTSVATTAKSLAKDTSKTEQKKILTTAEFLLQAEKQRMDWENGVYVEASKQLYAVLAHCYAFLMKDNGESFKEQNAALEAFYEKRKYTYSKKTPLASRVVRAVFGNVDRRRISTYSIVIRRAMVLQIEVNDFAQWIDSNGGVQEIKLGRSATYVSKKDKAAAIAKKWKNMQTLAIAADDRLRMQRVRDFDNKHCLLVAMQNKDGTYAIKGVVHTNGIVEQAMATLLSSMNAEERSVAKAKQQVDSEAANDAEVKVAA